MITLVINESAKLYFQASVGTTGALSVINEGVLVVSPIINYVQTVPGIFTITYTPSATGKGIIVLNGTIVAQIEVVAKSLYSFLRNVEDEAMGSWTWDKPLGKLEMLRQDGTSLANFDVVETLIAASRERTS